MVSSYPCVTKAKMKHGYLLGLIFLWNIYVSLSQGIEIINNCTCKTSDGGIYSLMPLRRTDGHPKFTVPGKQYPGWKYAYNPCTPIDVGQDDPDADPHKLCRDVAICQYAEIEKPREYYEVGLQRDISCEIGQEGQIELVYKTNDPSIDNPHSRVEFHCDESTKDPVFQVEDDDNYIFSIKHYCACRNRCSPQPGSSTPPQPGTFSTTTPSSEPKTTSSKSGTPSLPSPTVPDLNWQLKILLPSLLGALVVVICFVCFWMRLPVIQRARLCRCCHCYEQNRDPPREERNVFVTEKSPLISNHENDRAVEHEYPGVKGKLNEPVQEEDGDVKGESDFPGKD